MKRATNLSPAERPLYSEKDANAILEQAIGADGKNFTDENLEEMAKELGISAVQLEAAKEVWFNQQQTQIELEKIKTQRWLITMSGGFLIFMVLITIASSYFAYIVTGEGASVIPVLLFSSMIILITLAIIDNFQKIS